MIFSQSVRTELLARIQMVIFFIFCIPGTQSCASKKVLTSSGLGKVLLGTEMIPAGIGRYKGHTVRDTICNENDFQWRVALLKYPKGNVWIEEDFFGGNIINRIRVETSDIRLRNGMKVGITVGRLLESTSIWYINPAPAYRLFDFYSPVLPGIHFIVDDPEHDMVSTNFEDYPVVSFNPEAKIVAIVVY